MNQSPNASQRVERALHALKNEYIIIGKRRVKVGYSWLAIGILTGLTVGIVLVANRFGEFEAGEARVVSKAKIEVPSPEVDPEKIKDAERDTLDLVNKAKTYQKALLEKERALDDLKSSARRRRGKMVALAEEHPAAFLRVALPPDLQTLLPQEIADDVEIDIEVEGILTVLHEDDFASRRGRFIHILKSRDQDFSLHAPREFEPLLSNTKIKVRGKRIKDKIVIPNPDTDLEILQENAVGNSSLSPTLLKEALGIPEAHAAQGSSFGEWKVAVILVNFLDHTSQPWTREYVRGVMFNNPDSIAAYFREVSFGQFSLSGDVFGWYTLPIDIGAYPGCPSDLLAEEAIKAADPDVYFPQYHSVIFAFPDFRACHWIGSGNLGQTSFSTPDGPVVAGQIWSKGHMDLYVVGHELGHNLGLLHARALNCKADVVHGDCTPFEYGDPFDVMGDSYKGHFNALHKHYLRLRWIPSSQVQTVTANGTYTITPLETAGPGIKMLRIPDNPSAGILTKWYGLEFRQPIGFDSYLSETTAPNGVLVYYGASIPASETNLLDMTPQSRRDNDFIDAALTVGRTYTDAATGVSFTPLAKTATDVRVAVNLGGGPVACVREDPTVTITPPSQFAAPGTKLVYTVTVLNNDSTVCGVSKFKFSGSLPAGWTSKFRDSAINLLPGESGNTKIHVTSSGSAADGFYDFSVTALNSAASPFAGTATAIYVVSR